MKTYFSFGQIHVHKIGKRIFDRDTIVAIEAETHDEARNIMVDTFGQKWSNQYNELPEMNFFPKGVIDL